MPYAIHPSTSDSRSVGKDFDPEIPIELFRQLVGTRPMTPEGRLAIPKRLRIRRPSHGAIPHILGWSIGPWILSPRVRDIFEELEPGIQSFSPIELVSKIRGKEYGTYFLMAPPPKLAAVVAEKTEFSGNSPRRDGTCVLDARMIQGHHFWRGEPPWK
jgi:hypothetical protein